EKRVICAQPRRKQCQCRQQDHPGDDYFSVCLHVHPSPSSSPDTSNTSSMVMPKYFAILYASGKEATYFPVSMEVMVCLVVPTASASSSWEILLAFRSSLIFVFKPCTSALQSTLCKNSIACFALFVKQTLHFHFSVSCLDAGATA